MIIGNFWFNIKFIAVLLIGITVSHGAANATIIRENSTFEKIMLQSVYNSSCIANGCRDDGRLSISLKRSVRLLSQMKGACSPIDNNHEQENVLLVRPSNKVFYKKRSFVHVNYTSFDGQKINLECIFTQ